MLAWLDRTPIGLLVLVAVVFALLPFRPMPHLVEKLIMLREGTLRKPLDIFDLIYHLIPTLLVFIKLFRKYGA